jgi:hypothetical protein
MDMMLMRLNRMEEVTSASVAISHFQVDEVMPKTADAMSQNERSTEVNPALGLLSKLGVSVTRVPETSADGTNIPVMISSGWNPHLQYEDDYETPPNVVQVRGKDTRKRVREKMGLETRWDKESPRAKRRL